MASHVAKMGRWRAETVEAMADYRWRLALEIKNVARGPLFHLHASAMKHSAAPGDPKERAVSFVAILLWGKAAEIANEFVTLLSNNQWTHVLGGDLIQRVPPECSSSSEDAIVALACNAAAEFDSRIRSTTRVCPQQILLFAAKPRTLAWTPRADLAKELLDADRNSLETTTLNILLLYESDIKLVVADGQVPRDFFEFIFFLARQWRACTQEVEGLNGILNTLINRSPNISLALSSARLTIRRALLLVGASGPLANKWSVVEPAARALLEDCLEHLDQAQDYNNQDSRWESVVVAPLGPLLGSGSGPSPSLSLAWGCRDHLVLHEYFLHRRFRTILDAMYHV